MVNAKALTPKAKGVWIGAPIRFFFPGILALTEDSAALQKMILARLELPFTRILYARRLSTFKFESLTHNLQEGISTPHYLVAWWWITLSVEVTPNPGD